MTNAIQVVETDIKLLRRRIWNACYLNSESLATYFKGLFLGLEQTQVTGYRFIVMCNTKYYTVMKWKEESTKTQPLNFQQLWLYPSG